MVVVRSVRIVHIRPTRAATRWSCGSSFFTRSTTSMMFAPGWRWMLTMTAGVVVHPRRQRERFPRRRSRRRRPSSWTGAPLR